MTSTLRHQTLQALLSLWVEEIAENGLASSLGTLTARDIEYFRRVFKDGFVAHGPRDGPYRLTFVGTDLESLLGRNLTNTPFGLGLPHVVAVVVENAFSETVRAMRPLLIEGELIRAESKDQLAAQILCLPFGEQSASRRHDTQDREVSILGLVTITGLDALPPEAAHRKLEITAINML